MAARLIPINAQFRWDAGAARHLLNRGGFGVPHSSVEKMVSLGAEGSVDALVNYERFPDTLSEPDFLSPGEEYAGMRMAARNLSDEERRKEYNRLQRLQRQEIEQLKVWWLNRMRKTSRPLEEKMALFWHGHFATSAQDIKNPLFNHDINSVFRTHATGNYRALTFAVGKTPAMLNYLNNKQNRKGHPNENWARELMELFTMGIGNYTEEDIKEAARAFSGYTEVQGEFTFNPRQHDDGEKTFLGRTGNLDGRDIINIIFEQPETARFISRKLWEYLVYTDPDEAIVEECAELLRKNDYELRPLLTAIFLSEEFYGQRARAGQIKSPAQYIVMLLDQLGADMPAGPLVALAMRGLGQDLFYPPNVKGWEGNRAWINTNTLLLRYNIPGYVISGSRPSLREGLALDEAGADTEREVGRSNNRRVRTMNVAPLFAAYEGKTAEEAVDGIINEFVGRPLGESQRATLVSVLTNGGGPSVRVTKQNFDNNRGAATLHLLLSTAEYQLC